MNYYPITDDKADLDMLFKRWKANNIFPNLSEDEVDFFITWHGIKGYIKPFILHDNKKVYVNLFFLKNNDEIIRQVSEDGNFHEIRKRQVNYLELELNRTSLSRKKDVLLSNVYLSKEDIRAIELGAFNKLTKAEQRKASFDEFRLTNKQELPGDLKIEDAWSLLNNFDPGSFPPLNAGTARKFFNSIGIKFKPGRRKNK